MAFLIIPHHMTLRRQLVNLNTYSSLAQPLSQSSRGGTGPRITI